MEQAAVQISTRVAADEYAGAARRVADAAGDAVEATGAEIYRSGRSDSYVVAGKGSRQLAVFGFFDGIRAHARLVAGSWPASTVATEAVVPEAAARALGVSPGDIVRLTNAIDGTPVAVAISGLYRPADTRDPFWWGDQLELEGAVTTETTTFGPFVVPQDRFFDLAAEGASARWRVSPRFRELAVTEVGPLAAAVRGLEDTLNAGRDTNRRFHVDSGLPEVLGTVERSLLVARSGVLIPSVQLAILAAWALLFTAGLLVERRGVETAILRSRGAGAPEVATLAAMEGLVLAVPAAVAAPWLAALSLGVLNHIGPLAGVGLALEPRVGLASYVFALAAGLACVAALSLPALRGGADVNESVALRGRPSARGLFQRAGLDLVLLAVAVVAYWQLRRYGGPLVESVQGRIGIDPFLVAAPALGLLAGAVVALRAVPAAARVGETTLSAARGVVAALGMRQLARRPGPYARSALLLVLALAIGVFAAAYSDTWIRSQRDQADYAAGADVRVEPSSRTAALEAIALADAYRKLPGVVRAAPALEQSVDLSRAAGAGQLLALDAEEAGEIVPFRSDLGPAPLSELLKPLAARRSRLPGIPLEGRPHELVLTAGFRVEPPPAELDESSFPFFQQDLRPALALVLEDGHGLLHRIQVGGLGARARPYRVRLAERPAGGGTAAPDYPLRLVSVELGIDSPFRQPRTATLTVERLATDAGPVPVDPRRWRVSADELRDASAGPRVLAVQGPVLRLAVETGATGGFGAGRGITFTSTVGALRSPAPIPALVTRDFLELTDSAVGSVVPLGGEREQAARIVIADAVDGFPTLEPGDGPGIVVDLPTFLAASYAQRGTFGRPSEWWLDTAPGQAAPVARRLEAPPFTSTAIVDRRARARALQTDPVALGISGALSLGFVAAAVFAVVGFAVSAAVATRERTTEFAVLRSLGLSTRQVSSSLALESAVTVALSLAGGVLLGVLLAWFVLPYVSLTGAGERAVPPAIVSMPWLTVVWLVLGLLVAVAVVVAGQMRLLGRIQLAPALRLGEDR